jgi:putative membrane protein
LGCIEIPIQDRHESTFLGEDFRATGADSFGTTCDHDDTLCKSHGNRSVNRKFKIEIDGIASRVPVREIVRMGGMESSARQIILPAMPIRDTIYPLFMSRTLFSIASIALAMGLYALLPVLKEYSSYKDIGDAPSDLHAALSLVLGWLLVFRTNAAYARWWEARTLWGSLINCSRNLAIKIQEFFPDLSHEERHFLSKHLSEFPKALTCHLRKVPYDGPVFKGSTPTHVPLAISQDIYRWISSRLSNKAFDRDLLRILDCEAAKLMGICGACERIAKTPMVRSYRIFARQCIFLFLLTLPWGLVQDFMWWTLPLTIVVSYFMVGMEIVAEHVEEPFGFDEDDLDLEGMSTTIANSVEEIFYRNRRDLSEPSQEDQG